MQAGCFAFDGYKDVFVLYKVEEGEHHFKRDDAISTRPRVAKDTVEFKAWFTDSCLYDVSLLGKDKDDINKLYGITDCNSTPHQDSVRIGWRHDGQGTIELFSYVYTDGKRAFKKIGSVTPSEQFSIKIDTTPNTVNFWLNGQLVDTTQRDKDCRNGVRFRLFPYFGGNQPAPNDMRIFISEK